MKLFYLLVAGGVIVVIGLLLFPTVNGMVDLADVSACLPLIQSAKAGLPYAFLGFVFYAIWKVAK